MTFPRRPRLLACLALTAATAFAQSTPTFTVVKTGLDAPAAGLCPPRAS